MTIRVSASGSGGVKAGITYGVQTSVPGMGNRSLGCDADHGERGAVHIENAPDDVGVEPEALLSHRSAIENGLNLCVW